MVWCVSCVDAGDGFTLAERCGNDSESPSPAPQGRGYHRRSRESHDADAKRPAQRISSCALWRQRLVTLKPTAGAEGRGWPLINDGGGDEQGFCIGGDPGQRGWYLTVRSPDSGEFRTIFSVPEDGKPHRSPCVCEETRRRKACGFRWVASGENANRRAVVLDRFPGRFDAGERTRIVAVRAGIAAPATDSWILPLWDLSRNDRKCLSKAPIVRYGNGLVLQPLDRRAPLLP